MQPARPRRSCNCARLSRRRSTSINARANRFDWRKPYRAGQSVKWNSHFARCVRLSQSTILRTQTQSCAASVLCGLLATGIHLLPAQARPWTLLFAPKPPPYPDKVARPLVTAQAQKISDDLNRYIEDWMDGKVAARIPDALVPQGNDFGAFKTFTLVRPDQITPAQQWAVRPRSRRSISSEVRRPVSRSALHLFGGADAGALWLARRDGRRVSPRALFRYSSRRPRSRPTSTNWAPEGVPEVPLLDADIEPLPGQFQSVFAVGADRQASATVRLARELRFEKSAIRLCLESRRVHAALLSRAGQLARGGRDFLSGAGRQRKRLAPPLRHRQHLGALLRAR